MLVKEILDTLTKVFLSEFKITCPGNINVGYCWLWAVAAQRLVGGALCLTDTGRDHAWLCLEGTHYDAEYTEGVTDPCSLTVVKLAQTHHSGQGYYTYQDERSIFRRWGKWATGRYRRRLRKVVEETRRTVRLSTEEKG